MVKPDLPNTDAMTMQRNRAEINDLFKRKNATPFRTSYDTREVKGTMQHDRYNHLMLNLGTDHADTTYDRFTTTMRAHHNNK